MAGLPRIVDHHMPAQPQTTPIQPAMAHHARGRTPSPQPPRQSIPNGGLTNTEAPTGVLKATMGDPSRSGRGAKLRAGSHTQGNIGVGEATQAHFHAREASPGRNIEATKRATRALFVSQRGALPCPKCRATVSVMSDDPCTLSHSPQRPILEAPHHANNLTMPLHGCIRVHLHMVG
jgi:hypothetical protein